MKPEVRRKRDELRQRQIRFRNQVEELRGQMKRTVSTPRVLIAAFSLGFVVRSLLRRRPRRIEAESVSPATRRLTALGGVLLGTAARRGLRGIGRDIFQSASGKARGGSPA